MKNQTRFLRVGRLLLAVILSVPFASAFAQGDLTPPGSPAPTMKTLQQVEPRTDLQATTVPAGVDTSNGSYHFIINQAGSYYLSANLGVTKTNGIQINAEGVTLDLNGFEISRASGTGGNGIEIVTTAHRATVRNGSIQGFSGGVNRIFAAGSSARACSFRDLSVSYCTSSGISAGEGAVVESCRAYANSGAYAISAHYGSSLSNCTARNNTTTYGIHAEIGSSLTNCTAINNTGLVGINVAAGSSLTNCSAGINTSAAASSAGIRTGTGCTITHCSARSNTSTATASPSTGMGFDVGESSTIQGCTALFNRGDGITLAHDSVARGNTCDSNGNTGEGAGIHATGSDNRIEGNNVTENDRGIDVDVAGNLIVKNSASGNTTSNYEIAAGNFFGAIMNAVVPAGSPTPPPVSGSSAPSSITTTDPWANISY